MLHITAGPFVVLLLLGHSFAHFILNYPNTIGFDDDLEASAPCGGFNVTFANSTDFHVGGDAIAMTSTHPAANWLFRATLDKTASGNWTDVLPVVGETGLGNFCESGVVVPSTWAGQQGIIQVIQHGPDGMLFQCAAVNFTTGSNPSPPESCKNATGLTAVFTSDAVFSSIPATASMTASAMASMTASATATASASGTTKATQAASSAAAKSEAVSTKLLFAVEPLHWLSMVTLGIAAAVLLS
ncbi:MAG: expression library immunization antigen 1 [Lasallia pustulata]|uniref:Expression library immunization antigen 1 n=1 Tax=Lasallia pustulata TaxID=136370 RepID=A0A5M8PFZ7_9LECA|nr:MAG: expression library immunization antigen 1 [Lasallia pustulata]